MKPIHRTARLIPPCAAHLLLLTACSATVRDTAVKRPAMPQFAILMYETNDAWHRKPQAERDALLERYMAWIKDLRAKGAFKDGTPIGRGGRVLAKDASGAVRATAIDVNAASLTGYFIIEARDLAHAEELARGSPAVEHGETVQIRPVGHE